MDCWNLLLRNAKYAIAMADAVVMVVSGEGNAKEGAEKKGTKYLKKKIFMNCTEDENRLVKHHIR